jgi:glyoxylase-like metal-dependent hydrolase (beta-lactamase superfamily II)
MKIFDDLYVYPWLSYEANNCNAILIDGKVPTLIDPGHTQLFNHVLQGMAKDGKDINKVQMVLCTHSHPDHIEAIERFDDNVLRTIGKEEHAYLYDGGRELFMATGCTLPKRPFTVFLKEGAMNIGGKEFQVIHTPGHSPGSICLYWKEKRTLISGDTLFYMGVGRTDLPGGDMELLAGSIAKLAQLDIECLVPGHGEPVLGEKAVKKNFQLIIGEFFA